MILPPGSKLSANIGLVKPEPHKDEVAAPKAVPSEEKRPAPIKKATAPLASHKSGSKFSIVQALQPIEIQSEDHQPSAKASLPASHFSETDLENAWKQFLEQLRSDDIVIFSAVNSFKITKKDETTILIGYPSETSKAEFSKVQDSFFNHFRHLVNNHHVTAEFRLDAAAKKEVMTKRRMFEKFAEINPLLRELDHLMKFDLS